MQVINYSYLGRKLTGGGLDSSNHRHLTFEEYYRLEKVDDLPSFMAFLTPAGRIIHGIPCFRISSSRVERITSPRADGSVTITIAVTCTTKSDIQEKDRNGNNVTEDTPPWLYGLEKFKIQSALQQENVTQIWPAGNVNPPAEGIRISRSKETPLAMRNTAGIPLEVTASRGVAEMSFTYNLEEINTNAPWLYVAKINRNPVRIAGTDFPERTLQIRNISFDMVVERNRDTSIRWTYYKVGIQFLIDPRTFNRDYLNTGLYVLRPNGPTRLWNWGEGKYYGSLKEYIESGYDDGEEVSEPVFLNESGTAPAPFDQNGKQLPVYLPGSIFEPIDFAVLKFPEERY